MKTHFLTAGIISAMLLSACAQNGQNTTGVMNGGGINKSDVGTLGGGALGALGGAQFGKGSGQIAAVAAGTLLGAFAGHEVGASLDRADMAYYNNTSQRALETAKVGTTSTWSNPDSGHSGSITPTRTVNTPDGSVCREYTQTINIGGKSQQAFGKSCRQADGSWQIAQ